MHDILSKNAVKETLKKNTEMRCCCHHIVLRLDVEAGDYLHAQRWRCIASWLIVVNIFLRALGMVCLSKRAKSND
eukprot:SAG11_NODE_8291_length_1033_cov_5.108657_1_plen_75_part_00